MKKYIYVVLIICFIFGSIIFADDNDFRSVKWGMSKKEVATAENQKEFNAGGSYKSPANMLIYENQKVGDYDCRLEYTFHDDKLIKVKYIFITHAKIELWDTAASMAKKDWAFSFDAYGKLKDLLTIKYGGPQEDNQKWANESWKGVGGSIPFHIAEGHLILNAKWDLGKTNICLNCDGNNSFAGHYLTSIYYYEAEYYKSLLPKEPEKKDL